MKPGKNLILILAHGIHRYLVWLVILSYVIAAVFPGFGLWIRHADIGNVLGFQGKLDVSLPLLLLALLLFNAGLGVKLEELRHVSRKPLVLAGGVFGNVATPLVFIVAISFMLRFWHNTEEAQQILVGLALVASMPIAGASTAWAQNASGNLALSLGLVLLTTLLSPLLTPLALHTVGFVTLGDYSEDLHELASGGAVTFLGAWVILPSLLGILAQWFVGHAAITKAQPYMKLVNYCVLIVLNYSNASLTLPTALAQPDFDFLAITLAITLALCLTAFSSGYGVARVFHAGRKESVSLMFGLGMNNNGTGLVLASMALVDHPQVMLPIIVYNLVQHLVASVVDFYLFRRHPK